MHVLLVIVIPPLYLLAYFHFWKMSHKTLAINALVFTATVPVVSQNFLAELCNPTINKCFIANIISECCVNALSLTLNNTSPFMDFIFQSMVRNLLFLNIK